jgi:uncharacterized protein
MPKKLIRRWLPTTESSGSRRVKRWLGPVLDDPNLLHLNRHSVSAAFFVGLFCGFLPIPGQTVLAAILALWLRCNLPISLILLWISNPVTFPPLMILLYKLGTWLMGSEQSAVLFDFSWSWSWFVEHSASIYLPIILGGLVAGLLAGLVGYFGIQGIWRWKVNSNWRARNARRLNPK